MKRIPQFLPQISLSILLALSLKPRHGYEIMKQVAEDSAGKIKLGPGSLYTSLKQLTDDGLVEELDADARRRYYQLTSSGWTRLTAELDHFDQTLALGRNRIANRTPSKLLA